jgi:flagellar basal-body rod modification protein FlgD
MVSTSVNTTSAANPNGSVASSSNPADASKSLSQTYNQFLTLLTTQLKNQDPLSPMDSTQFTSQLVQFSQVEQQINTNKKLDSILSQDQVNQTLQAAAFIGSTVEAAGNTMPLDPTSKTAQFGYTFATKPDTIKATIYDSTGNNVIRTLNLTPGQGHVITTWDGKDDNGVQQPVGDYVVAVTGYTSGKGTAAVTTVLGKVSDIQVQNGQTTVTIGDLSVPIGDIVSVKKS